MQQVLEQITLTPAITEALLYQRGKYAPYLKLAIACERFNHDRIAELAQQIGFDYIHANALHADALIWAQQVDEYH